MRFIRRLVICTIWIPILCGTIHCSRDGSDLGERIASGDPEDLAEIEPLLLERLEQSDAGSEEQGRNLNLLVELLWRSEDVSDETLATAERAIGLWRDLSSSGVGLSDAHYNMGVVRLYRGDFAGLESMAQSVAAVEAARSDLEPDAVAKPYIGYGSILQLLGQPEEARSNYMMAMELLPMESMPSDRLSLRMRGRLLHNLGELDIDDGAYIDARNRLEAALEIRRNIPNNKTEIAQSCNAVAGVLSEMGDFDAATALYQESLDSYQELQADRAASVRSNLGLNLLATSRWSLAERHFREALAYYRSTNNNPLELAHVLNNLADVLIRDGHTAEAAPLLREALALRAENDVPTELAETHNSLGDLSLSENAPGLAVHEYRKAREILCGTLGDDHPRCARALNGMAIATSRSGSNETAFNLANRAESIGRAHSRRTIAMLDQRRALLYQAARVGALDTVVSIASTGSVQVDQAWDTVIRSRAVVLDEMAARHRTIVDADDPVSASIVTAYRMSCTQYANLTLARSNPEPERLSSARDRCEAYEAGLAEANEEFRSRLREQEIGLTEVVAAMPANSAFVSYVAFDSVLNDGEGRQVGALIHRKGNPGVQYVDIGTESGIDGMVADWRDEFVPRDLNLDSYKTSASRLRSAIWDPVAKLLDRSDLVFIVPSGSLNLVSFATLPQRDGSYLVEHWRVHYLSAERDLTREPGQHGSGMLVLAGPDFKGPPTAPTRSDLDREAVAVPRKGSACRRGSELAWDPITKAEERANEIVELWARRKDDGPEGNAVALIGAEASVPAFKSLSARGGVIHLLTHGEFVDPQQPQKTYGGFFDPLLLSRLVLAGAACAEWDDPDYLEDGLLTARELATLDLSRVEWLVLSACNTGTGVIHEGEGVFGLRRAAQIAGAGTFVTSLWEVSQDATHDWMTELYSRRFSSDRTLNTATAVREATLARLHALRRDGQSTHPYWWGAFVAAGDWR